MGYPTSVQTFSAKNAGDTIQPSHVNDLQTEVAAVENGLLNGIQHAVTISTGGLTVSTGNTVLGGNLSVGGNSTITGSLVVSSRVTFSGQPRCVLSQTSSQSLADGVQAAVTFATESIDVGGLHSTSSQPTRVTIPAGSSGTYLLSGMVQFATSSAGTRTVSIGKNGVEIGGSRSQIQGAPSFGTQLASPTIIAVLDAADYVELLAQQNSGSTLSIGNASPSGFTVARLY